jgi:hypothetical protein
MLLVETLNTIAELETECMERLGVVLSDVPIMNIST